MKKFLLSASLLFAIFSSVQAQEFELFLPYSGFGMEAFWAENLDMANTGDLPDMLWLTFFTTCGGYVPLLRPNDEVSLGVDLSFRVGYSLSIEDEYRPLIVQLPVYGMARFGLNATAYSEATVGGGIGAGLEIRHIRFLGLDRHSTFVAPSVVLDLNSSSKGTPLGLRFTITPQRIEFLNRYTGDDPASSGGQAQHVDANFRSSKYFSGTLKFYF